MKKSIIMMLCIVLLLSACLIPVAATAYTDTDSYDFTGPYTKTYEGGTVLFNYQDSFMGSFETAYSGISAPSGSTGRVFVYIAYGTKEGRSSDAHTAVDGVIDCSASLEWYNYTTKTNHFALRNYNGTTNSWDYTCISPLHETSSNEEALLKVAKTAQD